VEADHLWLVGISFRLRLAGDAKTRPWDRIEPPGGDLLVASLADTIRAILDFGEGKLHFADGARLPIDLAHGDIPFNAVSDLIERVCRVLDLQLLAMPAQLG
jgi:hypothetical protein